MTYSLGTRRPEFILSLLVHWIWYQANRDSGVGINQKRIPRKVRFFFFECRRWEMLANAELFTRFVLRYLWQLYAVLASSQLGTSRQIVCLLGQFVDGFKLLPIL